MASLTVAVYLAVILGAVADYEPAQPCDKVKCVPPNCRCSDDFEPPGKLQPSKTPQIVLMTFDDDLNAVNFAQYQEVFADRVNPNGCPAVGTFFICHNYTSYYLVEKMYAAGHEAADHTVTHQEPTTYWLNANYTEWANEIKGEREILHKFANVPLKEVTGFRAPFLMIAENMYKALHELNFLYDLSWPTGKYTNPPMYPYTLDYKSVQDCPVGECPKMAYPGLWVIPNVDLMNEDGTVCGSMMDACAPLANSSAWFEILKRNFHLHYDSNRAPFGMHMHSAWFGQKSPDHMDALKQFLDYLAKMEDVWILSASQAIAWMQDPQNTQEAKSFKAWACPPRPPPRCATPNSCHYTSPGDFYMPTCTQCPPNFPSPTDPDGN